MDSPGSGQCSLASSSKYGNEKSGPVKDGTFMD
jgi:hypothetical protein